jgi:two-component system sensor histidine kinase VicK
MFLRTLQWRLVSFFCLVSVCLVIPIGFFLNISVEHSYYESFKEGIEGGFKLWTVDDSPDADEILTELRDRGNASLFLIIGSDKSYTVVNRNDNKIIYSSDSRYNENGEARFLNELLESDNFVQAMAGKTGGEKKLIRYGNRDFFDYARPVGDFVLYFRYYKEGWQNILDSFSKVIISSLLIALSVAFVLGYTLSKTITVPITRIMHRAKKIAGGDFDQALVVKSDDEIGKLTKTFNYMAKNLKDTLAEISSEKNKIETILNNMTDGVIAFNLKGEVIHTNPASKYMLGTDVINSTFSDYAEKYGLDFSLEGIKYLESINDKEFIASVGSKTIRMHFAVFTDKMKKPEGVIAVLQDITEQQKLDNMRKEFVANVSHELRTPLTSIKSYTETLLDGALEDRDTSERFLKVIDSEADRMTRLVKDLLELSRLDNSQMNWSFKSMSFVDMVKASVEKIEIEARNKNHTLECFVIGEIPDVRADYDRMEQVILNLLSNAIKYTPDGGKITVYIGKNYNEVYVKVSDTGIGIPEQDLPRLFERFYRVDKARSREMGGTGLGLAIAREIVESHGGTVSITSEYGKGTEVTVKLPVSGPDSDVIIS